MLSPEDITINCLSIFLALLSIFILGQIIHSFYRRRVRMSPGMQLIKVICWADIIWEVLLISTILYLMIGTQKQTFLKVLSFFLAITYSYSQTFACLIAICAYISVFYSEEYLRKVFKKIILIAFVVSSLMSLTIGYLFEQKINPNHNLKYINDDIHIFVIVYVAFLVFFSIFAYFRIYRVLTKQLHGDIIKRALRRLFIFPLNMIIAFFGAFIEEYQYEFLQTDRTWQNVGFVISQIIFSGLGLMNGIAYRLNQGNETNSDNIELSGPLLEPDMEQSEWTPEASMLFEMRTSMNTLRNSLAP